MLKKQNIESPFVGTETFEKGRHSMERFSLDQRMLPRFCYRVNYPGSQTAYK